MGSPLEFQRCRLLCLMGVVRAGVDFQFLEHRVAEAAFRQHSPDGFGDDPVGPGLEHFGKGGALLPAGVAAVALVGALRGLGCAGDSDVRRIDNDDEITRVHVRRIFRTVLAHQDRGDSRGHSAQDLVRRVDYVPLGDKFAFLGHVCFHGLTNASSQKANCSNLRGTNYYAISVAGVNGKSQVFSACRQRDMGGSQRLQGV